MGSWIYFTNVGPLRGRSKSKFSFSTNVMPLRGRARLKFGMTPVCFWRGMGATNGELKMHPPLFLEAAFAGFGIDEAIIGLNIKIIK